MINNLAYITTPVRRYAKRLLIFSFYQNQKCIKKLNNLIYTQKKIPFTLHSPHSQVMGSYYFTAFLILRVNLSL